MSMRGAGGRVGWLVAGLLATMAGLVTPAAAKVPVVVASIKPLHSLAASVMAGIGQPSLLIKGTASEHVYSMKPSDAALLASADVVFWVGEPLETVLVRPLANLPKSAHVVALLDTPGLLRLHAREGGLWEPHEDEQESGVTDAGRQADHGQELDGHIWLDPENAKLIGARMAEVLAAVDPANAARYRENAAALAARIDALEAELEPRLAAIANRPFIVFHDAYHYFERRFGLAGAGSITLNPAQPPGARRIAQIRDKLAAAGAVCVFHEPQFPSTLVNAVAEGTEARIGELDPTGAAIPDGPDLYFQLLRDMTASLERCLAPAR
ncbi:MAG: zinc ABC transporter substrate-binding protein [Pseudomonadota bacterium]